MPNISRSNIHLDILMGRDETLDVSDFFGSKCLFPSRYAPDGMQAQRILHFYLWPFQLQLRNLIPFRIWITVHLWNANIGYSHYVLVFTRTKFLIMFNQLLA